jgi:hypothetical protein
MGRIQLVFVTKFTAALHNSFLGKDAWLDMGGGFFPNDGSLPFTHYPRFFIPIQSIHPGLTKDRGKKFVLDFCEEISKM